MGDLSSQYFRDTSRASKYVPVELEGIWLCTCGAINRETEFHCHSCRSSKVKLISALDPDTLRQRNAEYQQRLINEAEAAAQKEAQKAAQRAAEREQRNAKLKKILPLLLGIVLLITAPYLLVTKYLIPNSKYNDASALLNAGQYGGAYTLFSELQGFRDSDELLSHFRVVCDQEMYTSFDEDGNIYDNAVIDYSYDDNGNLLSKKYEFGTETYCETYIYDNSSNLLSIVCTDPDGEICFYCGYSYDVNGNMLTVAGDYGEYLCYNYNELFPNYNNLSWNFFDTDKMNTVAYTYDDRGYLQTEFVSVSNYTFSVAYFYDDQGRLLERYLDADEAYYYLEYYYDNQGRLITEIATGTDHKDYDPLHWLTTEYIYDDQGNLQTKLVTQILDDYTMQYDYSYNDQGNLLKEIETDSYGRVQTTEYSYIYIYTP